MRLKGQQIVSILAFPITLTIGIVLIPIVNDYSNHYLAEQAVRQTARWFSGHIIAAVAFSLSIIAVCSLSRQLQHYSHSLPVLTLPLVAIGAGLYAAGLGADGIGAVAVQSSGHSSVIFLNGSTKWITSVFLAGAVVFGFGLISLVIGFVRPGFISGWNRYISIISVVVFMVAPAIPSGWALYGVAIAVFGVFLPFIFAMKDLE